MKQIQPITSWLNGQEIQANRFTMFSIHDNLSTSATFYYKILAEISDVDGNQISLTQVAEGNIYMEGDDYQTWGTNQDINEAAYIWGAQKLNLTLI